MQVNQSSVDTTTNSFTQEIVDKSIYSWVVIALCSFFLVYKYVLQISPSVITSDLMQTFHVGGLGLGNLAASYFYAFTIMQIVAGFLLDRYSPRYFISFAILCASIGTVIFAKAVSLPFAELGRALMGTGTAFATVGYMKMSALWFQKKRMAFVDGLLATAGMIGALSSQVPLTLLIAHSGWRQGIVYCGLAGFALAFLFWLIIRDKKAVCSDTQQIFKSPTWQEILAVLKIKKNWILTLYCGLAFTPLSVLGGLWGNPFFEEAYHLTPAKAASFTSFIFIGFAVGGPLFGLLADYLGGHVKAIIKGTLLSCVTLFLAIYVLNLPLFVFGTLLFLFGLGIGSLMLIFPFGKSLNHFKMAATVVALINTGDSLFSSFTEPLIGKILDIFWQGKIVNGVHYFSLADYQKAFSVLLVYMFLGLGCLFILRKMQKKEAFKTRP